MWVEGLCAKHGKDHVMIGMEPTGHYWFSLAEYAKCHSMETVLVNPYHVKRCKELDDNNPTKNDRKDPKTIAMLVKDGRYVTPYIPDGVYGELGTLTLCLPVGRASALVCLEEFPTPALVMEQGIEGIIQCWKKVAVRRVGVKRATRLYEAAKRSVNITQDPKPKAAREELSLLLEEYALLKRQEQRIMDLVAELLLKIKGVGLVTAAGFLSEVGDLTRFDSPKQIQKYAGLNLKENSSGKHKGRTTISKRGRSSLRALLFSRSDATGGQE